MWKKMLITMRNRLLSGALLFVPFGVTLLVMRWLFQWLAGFLRPAVMRILIGAEVFDLLHAVPETYVTIGVSVVSIVILLFLLYLVGAVGQLVLGRRLINLGERILMLIPLVRSIYSATKQVVQAVSVTDGNGFKAVVLVEFPRPGFMAVGFLTGYIEDAEGRKYGKVFIPTCPNPTTGFFEIVPAEELRKTSMAVEDALKMIISGGLVSGDIFRTLEGGRSGVENKTS